MKFGRSLERSIYNPWRKHYLDYAELKKLLREDDLLDGNENRPWTDEDEQRFVDELVNVQLEKVNSFQEQTYHSLTERTGQCERKLENFVTSKSNGENESAEEDRSTILSEVLNELDHIREEITRLEKFSRINYTGALKAAKKHDRRRGTNYKVRPLLQVRLASLPFNSEDYSPLLYRLSAMYSFVRENLSGNLERPISNTEPISKRGLYTSHKFFIHKDNLLELKTSILRHLPVLVYTPKSLKIAEGTQHDPSITSLYFDNANFTLYNGKLEKGRGASSLRLRWYGQLKEKPELTLEKKTLTEGDDSEEIRTSIKDKYVLPFIKGDYKMEKQINKLWQKNGEGIREAEQLEKNVEDIQGFLRENDVQPIMRANYTRTAFQIPGEDMVRISLDTNMAFIREDCLDGERPCRDPAQWHRTDVDDRGEEYPFQSVRKGEISRFPYALLEIKVREGTGRRYPEWVEELMASHLVREAPRFSKFVHGVASLFEDHINSFPFWMSLMETDIRRDPEQAFEEEQERKAKQAEDEMAVGSFIDSKSKSPFLAATGSPVRRNIALEKASPRSNDRRSGKSVSNGEGSRYRQGIEESQENDEVTTPSRLRDLLPYFSNSKYARAKRNNAQLPPGVKIPDFFIKDIGPVRVEPKVWLANQRTFIKWAHIAILLSTLSVSLYNGAGADNDVARALAVVYTLIAIFAGAWGWWTYISRSRMIYQRSGEDLDSILGPIIVCMSLATALLLNFGLRFHAFQGSTELLQSLHLSSGAPGVEL